MLRGAGAADLPAILSLLDRAFAPSRYEAKLVESLLARKLPLRHWALEQQGAIVAYVCYSLAYRGEKPIGYHLAPVAVLPESQRCGFGSRIISETLQRMAPEPVFVLGDPAYYARFGFRQVCCLQCPFDPEMRHFMALRYSLKEEFEIGYEAPFFAME